MYHLICLMINPHLSNHPCHLWIIRNMILGANGLYFLTMAIMGRSYAAFDIAMFIISAISYIGCFQFMR